MVFKVTNKSKWVKKKFESSYYSSYGSEIAAKEKDFYYELNSENSALLNSLQRIEIKEFYSQNASICLCFNEKFDPKTVVENLKSLGIVPNAVQTGSGFVRLPIVIDRFKHDILTRVFQLIRQIDQIIYLPTGLKNDFSMLFNHPYFEYAQGTVLSILHENYQAEGYKEKAFDRVLQIAKDLRCPKLSWIISETCQRHGFLEQASEAANLGLWIYKQYPDLTDLILLKTNKQKLHFIVGTITRVGRDVDYTPANNSQAVVFSIQPQENKITQENKLVRESRIVQKNGLSRENKLTQDNKPNNKNQNPALEVKAVKDTLSLDANENLDDNHNDNHNQNLNNNLIDRAIENAKEAQRMEDAQTALLKRAFIHFLKSGMVEGAFDARNQVFAALADSPLTTNDKLPVIQPIDYEPDADTTAKTYFLLAEQMKKTQNELKQKTEALGSEGKKMWEEKDSQIVTLDALKKKLEAELESLKVSAEGKIGKLESDLENHKQSAAAEISTKTNQIKQIEADLKSLRERTKEHEETQKALLLSKQEELKKANEEHFREKAVLMSQTKEKNELLSQFQTRLEQLTQELNKEKKNQIEVANTSFANVSLDQIKKKSSAEIEVMFQIDKTGRRKSF